ncbi:DUF2750 domain-containing protein [Saccharospirillum impatiens]|uniref:DUF2750 domain-containing protein n=1 Tax=Saccharospirillum impatiens TaxID=169438 RepID=UPI00041CD019|nr:DUF2750 domain-containing protein [Saccharospirillum impatiens]
MTNSLSPEELQDLQALSPADRYDYLIERVQAGQSVWSLRSDQGTVLMSSDGQDCLPVWPHTECAQAWINGDWADCTPLSIDAAAWEQRWLPGLQADGVALAVFPSQDDEGIVVEPDDMAASLTAE